MSKTTPGCLGMLFLILGLPACSLVANPPSPSTPVTVQLSFLHQAQFAGFYAAEQHKDFR